MNKKWSTSNNYSLKILFVIILISSMSFGQFSEKSSDFNGDGYDDLAIGIPGKDIINIENAGAVRILYGGPSGLSSNGTSLLRRGNGIPGSPITSERLGETLAVGDFNGDGFADLAIGAPLATVSGGDTGGAGNLSIIYGTSSGLGTRSDSFEPNAERVSYAKALIAGDFNNDGFDELAVGVPRTGNNQSRNQGTVVIYLGSSDGLVEPFDQRITRSALGHGTQKEEMMGSALTAGDFNRDGFMDLAIGASGAGVTELTNLGTRTLPHGGVVFAVYGSTNGLVMQPTNANQLFSQNTPGMIGGSETADLFGASLVAANFDGTGATDLAIGTPLESFENRPNGDISRAGVVNLLFGFTGLSTNNDQMWHQDVPGVAGVIEASDNFGYSVACGDFNADGKYDLVIGVPNEDFGGFDNAGVFHVLYGSPRTANGPKQLWGQDTMGLGYGVEKGDKFGHAFGSGDYNGDGFQDLAISAPGEGIEGTRNAGSVIILYGRQTGLSPLGSQFWAEHVIGLSRVSEGDGFGKSLSNAAPMKKGKINKFRQDALINNTGTFKQGQ